MAESLVSLLLNNLNQLLKQDSTTTFSGFRDLIKPLQIELVQVNQYLQNPAVKIKILKHLMTDIRPVVQEAEYVIDSFVKKMMKLDEKRNKLAKSVYSNEHAKILSGVAKEIDSITKKISTIYNTRDSYGVENNEASATADKPNTGQPSDGDGDELVVSFLSDEKMVKEVLNRGGLTLDVVSIAGMGGSGKTTLAKKIYNNDSVKQQFDCRAWVCVSRDQFQRRDLLFKIIRIVYPDFKKDTSKMSNQKLAKELAKFLKDKRYLVVLDDVWDVDVWLGLRSGFPDSSNSSRILITSRITDVATCANSSSYYSPPLLNMDNAWELFRRIAFHDGVCPLQLIEKGRRIVKKCEGLPLAIVVMASLLAKEEEELSPQRWSQVAANVNRNLQKQQRYLEILGLSYWSLPTNLKPCFLYFGMFPKHFEIRTKKLYRLWVLEGFIVRNKDGRSLEAIAEDYLEELVGKSLITVVTRRSRDGSVKSCTIHDRLRDLCIYEGVRENFLTIHTKYKLSATSRYISSKPRRLSLHCNTSRYISSPPCDTSSVQTLMCFGDNDDIQDVETFTGFRFVKVLDFGATTLHSVPTQIKKLIHLKYLRMNAPHLREIPSCISSLPNLETLDIRESGIIYFTDNFWKMQKLKHLFLFGDCDVPRKDQDQFKCMPNLETLSTISPQIVNIMEDFRAVFPSVKKLGLENSHIVAGSKLPEFQEIQNLKIIGPVSFLFQPVAFTSNLTKVTLVRTEISSSVFTSLGMLPNLQVLKLMKQSLGEWNMECSEGSFPELQVLHMVELEITKWTMKKGAMKKLEYLLISKCVELKAIPQELKDVSTLFSVHSSCCSSILEKSICSTLGKNIHTSSKQ